MSTRALIGRLEQRHGLRLDTGGRERLAHALAAGGARDGLSVEAEAARVIAAPPLEAALVEQLTVQESGFFRDARAWATLAQDVLPAAIRAADAGPLTVWSAGCANGQEAWSLAMLLTELGAPRFEVVASDVSASAVARAVAGTYGERELHGLGERRRERFFTADGTRWRVTEALRRHVRVVQANAAFDPPPVAPGSAALVLCRYVLIYLTAGAAEQVLAAAERALRPEGRLLIGAAESLWHLSERFVPTPLSGGVSYRRRRADDPTSPREALRAAGVRTTARRPASVRARPGDPTPRERRHAPTTAHGSTGARTEASDGSPDATALRRDAEEAAARGDLEAAAAGFRGAAHLDADDAIALVGLGLALETMGDPGAEAAFASAWAALQRRPTGELEHSLGELGAAALIRLVAERHGGVRG